MGMSVSSGDTVRLWAKQEIRDLLARYCRGLDRMDKALALSVFHDDATADYLGMYQGTGHGFVDWVWDTHAGMERHSHQITNVLTEVDADGERAASEAYVTVCLWTKPDADGHQLEIVTRGRYLDRWSHDGRWAISSRVHVLDMQAIRPVQGGDSNAESRRDTDDASYQLFDG